MAAMNDQASANMPVDDDGVPVSVKIRERVNAARKRYYANDNIAEFVQPGEMEAPCLPRCCG